MKFVSFIQYENGLTFIEILIVLFITSIIALTVIPILNTSINSNQFDIVTVEDIQQARRALKRITAEINYSDLNSPININSDPSGNQILRYNDNNGNPCSIFLNRGTIFFQQQALAPVSITTQNTIQNLIFQFNNNSADNRNINIMITLRNGRSFRSTARKLNQRN